MKKMLLLLFSMLLLTSCNGQPVDNRYNSPSGETEVYLNNSVVEVGGLKFDVVYHTVSGSYPPEYQIIFMIQNLNEQEKPIQLSEPKMYSVSTSVNQPKTDYFVHSPDKQAFVLAANTITYVYYYAITPFSTYVNVFSVKVNSFTYKLNLYNN